MTDGQKLRQAREQLGLTQKEMAEKLGLSEINGRDYVREMEHDRRPVSGPIKRLVDMLLGPRGSVAYNASELGEYPSTRHNEG